jgi:hypothetical protein
MIIGDFYSNPEMRKDNYAARYPWQLAEFSGTFACYDYWNEDEQFVIPNPQVGTGDVSVYVSPRSWRTSQIWDDTTEAAPPAGVISPGGLHHIWHGMGDTGEGARVPQTLHTIDQGISS